MYVPIFNDIMSIFLLNSRVWSVRFNFFHDQLILSSSSDCKVLLTCAASVSSEASSEHSDKENLYVFKSHTKTNV